MSYAEAQYTIDEVVKNLRDNPPPWGVEPNNLSDLKIIAGDGHVYIHFTPTETIIDGQVLATVEGVLIRRKVGEYPVDEFDGDLVLDAKGEHLYAYSTSPYMDENVENGTTYYYRLFPYTHHNMINRSMQNVGIATPQKSTSIWGFHQDFTILDPTKTITYIGANENFTPMHTSTANSVTRTAGSWKDWVWFKKNKPFEMSNGGVVTGELNPNNHGQYISGTASHLNESFCTNYHDFIWFPKIYMKEVYADDGNSRDVYFSMNREGDAYDFIPVGFYNKNDEELEGVWIAGDIPRIYNHPANESGFQDKKMRLHLARLQYDGTNAYFPNNTTTLDASYTALRTSFGHTRKETRDVAFFGGPIANVVRDMLYMLFKTTDLQTALGYGYASWVDTESLTCINNSALKNLRGFYGSFSSSGSEAHAFHSRALLSYSAPALDPYTVNHNGAIYVNKNYTYSTTDFGSYVKTPITMSSLQNSFPSKLVYCGDGIGSMPIYEAPHGSSSTGLCDRITYRNSGSYPALRLGRPNYGVDNGPAYCTFGNASLTSYLSYTSVIPMLIPDPGYEPSITAE